MDDLSFIIFFTFYNAEDNLYPGSLAVTQSFLSLWRCGVGFFFYQKWPTHNGRRIVFLPDGLDAENEAQYPFDLHIRIFSGTFSERSFI